MDSRTVKEGAFWQRKVDHCVAHVEPFHIRPVRLRQSRNAGGERKCKDLFLAAPGCLQNHFASKCLREYLVEIELFSGEDCPIRQYDPHAREWHLGLGRDNKSRAEVEQVRPFPRMLGTGDSGGFLVDEGVGSIPKQPPWSDSCGVEFLAHHRLHGIPPQGYDLPSHVRAVWHRKYLLQKALHPFHTTERFCLLCGGSTTRSASRRYSG